MASRSLVEVMMGYESIPLSKRLAGPNAGSSLLKTRNNINVDIEKPPAINLTGMEVNWGGDLNITDPTTGYTPLMGASMNNNTYTIRVLLERGADIHFQDPFKGRIALHIACKFGQCEALESLLHHGSTINFQDNFGVTAVMLAAKGGHLQAVTTLIARGANVNIVDITGWSPLMYASKYGHKFVVAALTEAGADMYVEDYNEGKTAMMIAGQYGRKETVKMLADQGADVNALTKTEKISALMMAAKEGHKGTVLTLLELGADSNQHDVFGWTATHFAASWGRRETVGLLITYGKADINFQMRSKVMKEGNLTNDKDTIISARGEGDYSGGETPLMVAAKGSQVDVMNVLLDCGARIDRRSVVDGRSALAIVSLHGMSSSAECLLSRGANNNITDRRGMTPLMLAAIGGSKEIIILLLNSLADINALDNEGESAMSHANRSGRRSTFLSSVLASSAAAKSNIIPWLELEIPRMSRHSPTGSPRFFRPHYLFTFFAINYYLIAFSPSPSNFILTLSFLFFIFFLLLSVFLGNLLNGSEGLYTGLLQRVPDCDVYIVHCLVMIAVACKRAADKHPYDRADLTRRINDIDTMLNACMSANAMHIDENLGNTLLLNKTLLKPGKFRTELLASAFVTGPLAMCIDNELTCMLNVPQLETHIQNIFNCCLRDPGTLYYGCGIKKSSFLSRFRYCPVMRFVLEGLSKVVLLVLVVIILSSKSAESHYFQSLSDYTLNHVEAAILILLGSLLVYEVGQIEEKKWAVSSSMTYEYTDLEKMRYDNVMNHFVSNVWQLCDLATYVLIIFWGVEKIKINENGGGSLFAGWSWNGIENASATGEDAFPSVYSRNGRIALALSGIPLVFGLLRYPSSLYQSFGQFVWSIIFHSKDLSYLIVIFAFSGLAFGIAFHGIFEQIVDSNGEYSVEAFSTPSQCFRTLLSYILLNYDLAIFDELPHNYESIGVALTFIFLIWTVAILFNMIIARIMATHSEISSKASKMWILIKAKQVQQYILVHESSPLCMLPPPFNVIPALFYIPHVLYIWRARLYSKRVYCISLAGTICDKLIFFFLIFPAAIIEYIVLVTDPRRKLTSRLFSLFGGPFTIFYCCFGLFLKSMNEPVTKLLVKSRLSDGRLRISYGGARDLTECIGARDIKNNDAMNTITNAKAKAARLKKQNKELQKIVENAKKGSKGKGAKKVSKRDESNRKIAYNPDASVTGESVHVYKDSPEPRGPSSFGKSDLRVTPIMNSVAGKYAPTSAEALDVIAGETVAPTEGGKAIDFDDGSLAQTEGSLRSNSINDNSIVDGNPIATGGLETASFDDGSIFSKITDDDGSMGSQDQDSVQFSRYASLGDINKGGISFSPGIGMGTLVRVPKAHKSLDFPSNRFPKIYSAVDRERIFKICLPEYFVDNYTAAVNENNVRLKMMAQQFVARMGELEKSQEEHIKDIKGMLFALIQNTTRGMMMDPHMSMTDDYSHQEYQPMDASSNEYNDYNQNQLQIQSEMKQER